jgi:hypothetical protein
MDASQDRKLRVQITEQELLCKNGCGFYGTPQWNGFCSKCWRLSQQKKTIDHHKNRSLLSNTDEQKNDSRSSRFKSMLRKSPSMFSSSSPSTSEPVQSVSHSSSTATLQTAANIPGPHEKLYKYVLEYFGPNVAKDIDNKCRSMLEKIFVNARAPLDDISESVQAFYQSMKEYISKLKLIKNDFNQGTFMSELEEYICTEAYDIIFSDRADEEAADLSMQDRIRSLNWVTAGFLETAFDFSILSVHNYIDEAVTYIIDLNQYRSAREKLNCLVSCSKMLFDALKESRSGAPASADEFLPALIYIILHANPPLILSNMKFISRFALPSRVMRGESGYYFTNLSCALQFIQDMNAESLHMDKEEFEAYTSGRLGVPLNNRESDRNMAIKAMEKGLKLFDGLLDDQAKLDDRITAFSGQMEENCEKYAEQINTLLSEHPSEEIKKFCKTLRDPEPPFLVATASIENELLIDGKDTLENEKDTAGVEKGTVEKDTVENENVEREKNIAEDVKDIVEDAKDTVGTENDTVENEKNTVEIEKI